MCGRFTLTIDPAELQDAYSGLVVANDIRPYLQPRYNIAPSNQVCSSGEYRRKPAGFVPLGFDPFLGFLIETGIEPTRVKHRKAQAHPASPISATA